MTSNTNESITLSETIVPKAFSKGTSSYLFITTALETSPI